MEFTEAMRIMKRMCKESSSCERCPLYAGIGITRFVCRQFCQNYPEETQEILAKWSAEHPVKSRKQVLIERFPNVITDKTGTPVACASQLGLVKTLVCRGESRVDECRKCWNQPYEEPEK